MGNCLSIICTYTLRQLYSTSSKLLIQRLCIGSSTLHADGARRAVMIRIHVQSLIL